MVSGVAALAVLLALALLVLAVLWLLRRRQERRQALSAMQQTGGRHWAPPATPAPMHELADASLEARIAAWVAATPRVDEESRHAEPMIRTAPPAGEQTMGVSPASPPAPENVVQAVLPADSAAAGGPYSRFVGPVELWFGATHVAVPLHTETSRELIRLANVLLEDLASARDRAG